MNKSGIYIHNILFFTLLSVFLLPFLRDIIADFAGKPLPLFYNFGLDNPKDFYTFWIALFGAIGIAYNIYQNQRRISNQQIQIDIQVKEQRDNSFSKGVEMLGHGSESSRIGGVYSLFFLAGEFAGEYAETVFEILCAHIRTTTTKDSYQQEFAGKPSNEIQTILNLLFKDQRNGMSFSRYRANLRKVWLAGANLAGADLSHAYMTSVNLSGAYMPKASLSGANLAESTLIETDLSGSRLSELYAPAADLSGAHLSKSDLSGSYLGESNLSEADLSDAFLVDAYLSQANLTMTDLSGADLSHADLSKGKLHRSQLKDSILSCTDFSEAFIKETDFSEAIPDAATILPEPAGSSQTKNMAFS